MKLTNKTDPANQGEIPLYYLIGEAICMIQLMEGAHYTSITLKKDVKIPQRLLKQQADAFRKKNYKDTFGKAIRTARENNLYSDILFSDLEAVKEERNWLVHKLLHEHYDDVYTISNKELLFHRIKAISNKTASRNYRS